MWHFKKHYLLLITTYAKSSRKLGEKKNSINMLTSHNLLTPELNIIRMKT